MCGKEGEGIAVRDHIESNHPKGISLPCKVYGNTLKSRKQLRRHKCNSLIVNGIDKMYAWYNRFGLGRKHINY